MSRTRPPAPKSHCCPASACGRKPMTHLMRPLILLIPIFFATSIYFLYINIEPDNLSVHIGKPYDDVVRDSTFPVKAKTALYPGNPPHPSSTWISSQVAIKFDDSQYGFELPPTKFGAITYDEGKVSNITTSPMLQAVPFIELTSLLEGIQSTLKKSGWSAQNANDHSWLITTTELQKKSLQKELFEQVAIVVLGTPHNSTLAINVKCYERCSERNPATAKYLIDISIGRNYFSK